MQENEKDMNDLEHLAETGWNQLHGMLVANGLSNELPSITIGTINKSWVRLVAATLLFVLIFTFPFLLNDQLNFSVKKMVIAHSLVQKKNIPAVQHFTASTRTLTLKYDLSSIIDYRGNRAYTANNITREKAFPSQRVNDELPHFENREIALSPIIKNISTVISSISDDTTKNQSGYSKTKTSTGRFSKKIIFFAGVGMNVSAWSNGSFSCSNFNIHPGVSLVIPVSKKLSLHTGLWAFATVRGKTASTEEKNVFNYGASLLYSVNTTSIIKASYFDVPVTLHYSIKPHWSVGSGFQLSKLYKLNIREQKENYDNNNTLVSATVIRYNSTPTQAAMALQQKAIIKDYETRFIAETSYQQGKWLFSAGYYYGLGKTITLINPDKSSQQYRNEYLKIGIQYRLKGK